VQKTIPQNWRPPDILIVFVVLAFLLVFTYGLLFSAPYPGFYFNPSDGQVVDIYQSEDSPSGLEVGDFIERVGPLSLDDFHQHKTLNLFQEMQPGQRIEIAIRRDGEFLTVPWVYPGFNRLEFRARFFNIWWLAYIFWFIGMCTQLFMRPKDAQWSLFVADNYLTGMFIMLGAVSSFQIMASAILLRVVAWLLFPAYIHFHWIFPRSLRHLPRWLRLVFYALCGAIALWQLFQANPGPLYFVAVILAFGGSILLLIAHYIFQPEYRRELGILAVAAFFSLGFTIAASIVGSGGRTPPGAVLSLVALPILPGAYFYVLYQRDLGVLELRANRAISIYFFIILLGISLLLAFGFLDTTPEAFVFAASLIALIAALVGILLFPAFQSFVERRILGIKLPNHRLSETYSARIITSETLPGLLKLLQAEVFPSLLIRQYVFVRNLKTSAQVLLSANVTQDQVREEALMELLASAATGNLTPSSKTGQPFEWIHLMLPLRFGSDLIGIWLLGRRDPDDHYPQAEHPILQSLANQTAVALSNIIQTEQLKAMYEANIHRYEQERLHLAHDLHDSVLNEMAAILMKNDVPSLSPQFQESYDGLISRVREIVSDLRPPMLAYGLKFALDGLADNLSGRNPDAAQIASDIRADGEQRYPEVVENNIYRIVQEACENASKYAHSKSISISGELSPDRIDIKVSDDGIGFNTAVSLKLDDMLASKHFGLAGMHERASLIGVVIQIDSMPMSGTQIRVSWAAKDSI